MSGASALLHAVLSVALGFVALVIGESGAHLIGETLERSAGVLLVVFGVVYAWWSWRKGGHFHPGGSRLHRHDGSDSCDGSEGAHNPEHQHYHADAELIHGDTEVGGWWLAVIVGANPCILILPILMATAGRGPQ